nr:Arm DNA-binding domain-containing protein [Pedobacter sp. ASV19]
MKSNQKLSLLFWLRNRKNSKDGKGHLYVRITIGSQEEEIPLARKIHPHFWDVVNKKDTESGPDAKKTNAKIDQARVDLDRHFTVLQSQFEYITPLMLKNVYEGKPALFKKKEKALPVPENQTILQAFDDYINIFQKRVEDKTASCLLYTSDAADER